MAKEKTNPWLDRAVKNLLSISVAENLKEALNEWVFKGKVIDYGCTCKYCELCEHDRLRYHFKIENKLNRRSLLVGSSCILRFEEITVYDTHGEIVTIRESREKILKEAIKSKKLDLSLDPFRQLWRVEYAQREYIKAQAIELKTTGSLPPCDLIQLFKLLEKNQIEFKPEDYAVNLQTSIQKYELLSMNREGQRLIWRVMSQQQRVKYKGRMTL